jgi:tRNA threonylcarbamoyladenosine biosynthesis protein TsaB
MPSLLIETSTERGMVAIYDAMGVLYCTHLPFGYENSKHLIPALEKGLKILNFKLEDLQYIAVGIGPGSYTGIRIGVTIAKTLAFAARKPLMGLCSLQSFIPSEDGPFAVLIDAKIAGCYIITGNKEGYHITYDSAPDVCDLQALDKKLIGIKQIVTPNKVRLKTKVDSLYPHAHWSWEERNPDPTHMGTLAEQKFEKKDFTLDGIVKILYMRKTQAEIEKEKKESGD